MPTATTTTRVNSRAARSSASPSRGAIVTDPTIIVGDEPTGDLDQESAQAIMDLMVRLCEDLGKTLIIVTHDAKSAAYAKRTLHLETGRLVEAGVLAARRQQPVPQEA